MVLDFTCTFACCVQNNKSGIVGKELPTSMYFLLTVTMGDIFQSSQTNLL